MPLTDIAERLYTAAQASGFGGEDLAVVGKVLEALGRAEDGRQGDGAWGS